MAGPISIGAAASVSRGLPRRLWWIRSNRRSLCDCERHVSISAGQHHQPIVGGDEVLLLGFIAQFLASLLHFPGQ